jgi:hypothetical protein
VVGEYVVSHVLCLFSLLLWLLFKVSAFSYILVTLISNFAVTVL